MLKVFSTSYGEATVTFKSFANDSEDNPMAVYDCKILTPNGIIQTSSILLKLDETLTHALIEQVASTTTTKGRTANRAFNNVIREQIKAQKFNY